LRCEGARVHSRLASDEHGPSRSLPGRLSSRLTDPARLVRRYQAYRWIARVVLPQGVGKLQPS
jgi:hypothetical protein